MVQGLKEASRVEASHHRMQPKTYGSVTELADADGYRMMRATVGPGATMPSRTHEHRAERWIVVRGTGVVDIGDERFTLAAGDTAFIPAGTVHGVANPTDADLVIIQIQLGTFLADDDVDVSDEPPEVGSG